MQHHQQSVRPAPKQKIGSSPEHHHPQVIATIYGKKSVSHKHQSSYGGVSGNGPLTLPQLQVPIVASRNFNQLFVAKTQKTPTHGSKERPMSLESNTIGPFSNNDFGKMAHIMSIAEPTTPQKIVKELYNNQRQQRTGGTGKKAKTVHRKHKMISNFQADPAGAVEGGFKQAHQVATDQVNRVDANIGTMNHAGMGNNLQGSEKKLNKYDMMLQSLEAVAAKQRKTMQTGSSKKALGSTEATDPIEAIKQSLDTASARAHLNLRSNTLSISSCISKNTGSNTTIAREMLSLLHQQQLVQQQRQSIFDRNRPWNCTYCQPKQCVPRLVDQKIGAFSRQCIAHMVSRFMIKQEFYESRKVMELLNTNARSVLVAQFKDFLIYDDIYEFLTSTYQLQFSLDILTRHAVFYDSLKSLEVLCQYREDQIRDRHLVLHGLKPSYIGLEKPIQSILSSNLRNKLRIVLNKVRKIQLSRGILEESCLSDNSSNDLPRSPTERQTATSKKKKNFIKLIQSSMVQEYNFSRSQSGLLIVKSMTADRATEPRFDTNSSINFTNISYEREIEIMKGSVFDDSLEPDLHMNNSQSARKVDENITSMYHNAQMILDNLSSRPLTRQSIPQTNSVTPASRLHMYELHKQEDLKVRLPFCIVAPKKNQTGLSQSNNSLLSNDEIMINDNEEEKLLGKQNQLLNYESCLKDRVEYQRQLEEQSPEIKIELQAQGDSGDGYEVLQTINKSNSGSSKVVGIQQTTTVSAQLDGLGAANPVITQSSAHLSSLSQIEMIASAATLSSKRSKQSMQGRQQVAGSQSSSRRAALLKQQLDSFPQSAGARMTGSLSSKRVVKEGSTTAMPPSIAKKVKKLSISKECYKPSNETPCSLPVSERVTHRLQTHQNDKSQHPSALKLVETPGSKRGSRNFKPSPSNKSNFTPHSHQPQNKMLPTASSKALPQTTFATRAINSKKQSVPSGAVTQSQGIPKVGGEIDIFQAAKADEDFGDLSSRFTVNPQMRHTEPPNGLDEALAQKKQLSQFKQNPMLQMSPDQAAQKKLQAAAFQKERQSPTLPQTRQLLGKNSIGTKTFSSFTMKAASIGGAGSQQQQQSVQQLRSVKKTGPKSSSKRVKEQQLSQIEGAIKGAGVTLARKAVFTSEKLHFQTAQASTDKKRVSQPKNQLPLKEKVIFDALRKEKNSQQRASAGHIAALPSHQSLINESLAAKLMRNPQVVPGLMTHSKSTNSKLDLYSIANKLKLMNQPIQASLVPQSSQLGLGLHDGLHTQQFSSRRSTNQMKLSSRKVSVEQRDHVQFSRNSSQGQKQSLRFFSAEKPREASESESKVLKRDVKMQKTGGIKRPTKLMSASQQVDAYYTQRNLASVASVPANLQNFCSRNLAEGSIDKTRSTQQQLQRATKTLVDMQSKTKVPNSLSKKTSSQGAKQIQKLSRHNTNGAMLSPKGFAGEIGIAGIVTPRKLIKEEKTRNSHLGGSSQTQSQRLVTVNNGHPHVQSLKQTLTAAVKNGYTAKVAQNNQMELGQMSRNSGLHLASQTQTMKHLNGQQFVTTRGSNIVPSGLKQDLKLHSRKSSAVFTLSQGQKLQQAGLVGGSLPCNAKSFGSSVPKKTRKKHQ